MRVILNERMKHLVSTIVLMMTALTMQASAFILPAHETCRISVDGKERAMVFTAINLLESDLQRVLDCSVQISNNPSKTDIIVGTLNAANAKHLAATGIDLSWLDSNSQAFILAVNPKGQLVIAGSDSYGTAYGIIELTRILGVSPWEWWADVAPAKLSELRLEDGFVTRQSPDVTFRGIFINDEDWGLLPWASGNFEPNNLHAIGPKTTRKIFELMLRLRANLYWPPMHDCTYPFFLTEGDKDLATQYGITLGTSHCEPLLRNNVAEWDVKQRGPYNYITNREQVQQYWIERLKEVAPNAQRSTFHVPRSMFTLGMRGIHDGSMEGVSTKEE